MSPLNSPNLKASIRRVVSEYLALHAPDKQPELDMVFNSVFVIAARELSGKTGIHWLNAASSLMPETVKRTRINIAIWGVVALAQIALECPDRATAEEAFDIFEKRFLAGEQYNVIGELRTTLRNRYDEFGLPHQPKIGTAEILVPTLPDLELRVSLHRRSSGRWQPHYVVDCPGVWKGVEVDGPGFETDHEAYFRDLLLRLERLQEGRDIGISQSDTGIKKASFADIRMLTADIERTLINLGNELYSHLFFGSNAQLPSQIHKIYQSVRERIRTLQITSDQPWIPWELVRPYDAGPGKGEDFLSVMHQVTRWLPETVPAPKLLTVKKILFIEAGGFAGVREEKLAVLRFAEASGAEVVELTSPPVDTVLEALASENFGIIHFASHGQVHANAPDLSAIVLDQGVLLRPEDLSVALCESLRASRPLVFLNTCQSAQQGWSLTRLGGWVRKWVADCHASCFVGPQWSIPDPFAAAFGSTFYDCLAAGNTIGEATAAGRRAIRDHKLGKPAWLSFHVYAHPNARVY